MHLLNRERPYRSATPQSMNCEIVKERPAGVEPALPPWQGDRLPLHHGRDVEFQSTQQLGPEGFEPSPTWLKARNAAVTPRTLNEASWRL
jgi:hypothetical protein